MPERNIANYISMSQSYCHTVMANRVRHLIRLQNKIKIQYYCLLYRTNNKDIRKTDVLSFYI